MPIYGLPFKDEQLFDLVNVVLPGWLVLAVAPRWRHAQTISAVTALLASTLYAALLISLTVFPTGDAKVDFSDMFTYEGVVRGLSNRAAVLPCWVHYAAFDLWVGRWMSADSVRRGVPQLLLIPCLAATLFVGPAGLVLYHLLRLPFGPRAGGADRLKSA